MTYAEYEPRTKHTLESIYDPGEAASVTDWLLEDFTGLNRNQRKLNASGEIADTIVNQLEAAVASLLQHKPLQYVLGYAYFYNLKFAVTEAVLIPRPETEELVEWIISSYKTSTEKIRVLDVGTGSGCIPVCIKKYIPSAFISAIDISVEALQIAKKNAETHNTKVEFAQLDFLDEDQWKTLPKNTVIVSNPPYIPANEKKSMDKNVTDWEPGTALFVPDETPLLFYEKLALFGKENLEINGVIFMETHKDFATDVKQLFTQQGYTVELKKDMHGNDRMIQAVLTNNE